MSIEPADASFGAFARTHYEDLLAYVRSRTRGAPGALDIVQESFLRAMIAARGGQVANTRAYLFRIARNLLIDEARRDRTRASWLAPDEVSTDHPCHEATPERMLIAREDLMRLLAIVSRLPPRCQEVFMLRRFEDLDQAAIAKRLGLSRRTVEKHLRIALSRCLEGWLDMQASEQGAY